MYFSNIAHHTKIIISKNETYNLYVFDYSSFYSENTKQLKETDFDENPIILISNANRIEYPKNMDIDKDLKAKIENYLLNNKIEWETVYFFKEELF